jgi:hypothetical protein
VEAETGIMMPVRTRAAASNGATTLDTTSVAPLTATGRRWRLVIAGLTVVLLLAGTAWGQDDDFPFGPFRMYATSQRLDGVTSWYRIDGVTADGSVVDIPISRFALRRAELEGQMDRFRAHPELLGLLVTAYERSQPGRARLVELHIVRHRQPMRDGVPTGQPTEKIAVTWTR